MPWLSPKTEEAMRALVKEGHRHVMVVPVSFVNEHVETLYDMDVELGRELAPEASATMGRLVQRATACSSKVQVWRLHCQSGSSKV